MGRLARIDRDHALSWLHRHSASVHGDVALIFARAERETRRHAREDAWSEARDYVRGRMTEWERGWGFHASDAYVALEVCPKLARALRSYERHVQTGDEQHLVGNELLKLLEPDAFQALGEWMLELGETEHHRIWEEVIRYTRRRGRELVQEGRMPRDMDWDACENFSAKAAHVAEILVTEFDARARKTV